MMLTQRQATCRPSSRKVSLVTRHVAAWAYIPCVTVNPIRNGEEPVPETNASAWHRARLQETSTMSRSTSLPGCPLPCQATPPPRQSSPRMPTPCPRDPWLSGNDSATGRDVSHIQLLIFHFLPFYHYSAQNWEDFVQKTLLSSL